MKIKIALRTVFNTIFTAVFIFLGDKDGVLAQLQKDGWIGTNFDVNYLRLFLFLIGTFWGVIFIAYPYYKAELKIRKDEKIINEILKYSKKIFLQLFCLNIREKGVEINIRILVETTTTKDIIYNFYCAVKKYITVENSCKKIVYKVINIDGMHSDTTHKDLIFELLPSKQGVVGKVFSEKTPIVDFEMQKKSVKSDYNLTDFQYEQTEDLHFCAAIPIFNNQNHIIAVVSFDSKNKLTLTPSKEEQLKSNIKQYAKFLHLQFSLLNNS